MKKSHKIKHGGKRSGSGRKPLVEGEDVVQLVLKVPQSLVERIDAARGTLNRSQFVREGIDLRLRRVSK